MVGDMISQSLRGMSSNELFLLVEWIHSVLIQLTKPTHPDVREMTAAFEKDEERRAKQSEQFKGVPIAASSNAAAPDDVLRWQQPSRDDLFERPSKASPTLEEQIATSSKPGKKQKGKQLLFKMG